jgi:hypothetical protein
MAVKTKNKRHDAFSDSLHRLLLEHTKHPELRLMQMVINAIGVNDAYNMTDEQLLESLEDTYEK